MFHCQRVSVHVRFLCMYLHVKRSVGMTPKDTGPEEGCSKFHLMPHSSMIGIEIGMMMDDAIFDG